jgi:predicted Zn finger-like uncharacterized protein
MPIETTCPHCDASYTVADSQAGKKVRCKSCQDVFEVRPASGRAALTTRPAPRPSVHDDFDQDERPVRRRREEPEDDPDRPLRRRGRVEEEEEERPRRRRERYDRDERPRRRRGRAVPLWVWLLIGGAGAAVVGGIIVVFIVLSVTNPVTMANYQKLQVGMTEDEVIAIMGKPHGDTEKDLKAMANIAGVDLKNALGVKQLVWKRGDDMIHVSLMGGKVMMKGGRIGTKGLLNDTTIDVGKMLDGLKMPFGR